MWFDGGGIADAETGGPDDGEYPKYAMIEGEIIKLNTPQFKLITMIKSL